MTETLSEREDGDKTVRFIDLNADLGEGDPYDAELLTIVSSCNIACGGHAGDDSSMRSTIVAAIANDVAIGAHPSYPDREGFGRRSRFLTGAPLLASLIEQIDALQEMVAADGATLTHVKPHGALYNDAARESELAMIVAAAITATVPNAALVGPPASKLEEGAKAHTLSFVAEAFVDRAYQDDGGLVPRDTDGAVLENLQQVTAQAASLALSNEVHTQSGSVVAVEADTLCIHGDTSGAAKIAQAVQQALLQKGIEIRAIGRR